MNRNFSYEQIDVVEFLKSLGVRNVRDLGYEVSYSCPFVEGHRNGFDAHPSATMSKVPVVREDGELPPTTFHCFTCGKAGTAVSFLAEYEGVSTLVARKMLREKFGMAFREPEGSFLREIAEQIKDKKWQPSEEEWLQAEISSFELDQTYFDWNQDNGPARYMRERGFTPEILFRFGIGYVGGDVDRITIPVFDEHSRLIGFKGRTWRENDKRPRYLVLGGRDFNFETYDVSRVLYGFPLATKSNSYLTTLSLIVVEGELNAVSLHQKRFKNSVGISGQYISDRQAQILVRSCKNVLLMFDEHEKAVKAARKLERKIKVGVAPPTEKDPADSSEGEINARIWSASSSYLL